MFHIDALCKVFKYVKFQMREQPRGRWRHEVTMTKTTFASSSNGI